MPNARWVIFGRVELSRVKGGELRPSWALRLLLTHSAQAGFTALMMASQKGHLGAVRTLLAAGADKEAKSIHNVGGRPGEGGSAGIDGDRDDVVL